MIDTNVGKPAVAARLRAHFRRPWRVWAWALAAFPVYVAHQTWPDSIIVQLVLPAHWFLFVVAAYYLGRLTRPDSSGDGDPDTR